jgi:two-component system, OmpR family, phosphate regulon sensor histidine kinase PhoR
MKLRSKWVLFLLSLLILFLLLQSGFHYFFKTSLILSSFLALCLIAPLLLLLVRTFVSPVLILTRKAKDLAAGRETQEVFSGDEWEGLSKAISEVGAQSRERIEEITRAKEYHEAILGGMTEGVLLVDRRGRTLLVNEALKKLIVIPTNVNDKTTLEIIRSVELEEAVQDALHKGTNKTLEITLPSSGEKTFEVNVVGIPSPPGEGERPTEETRGVIVAFHDISRLKNLERIRQDFVANVSHELRTPLATIKGYAETLLDGAWKEQVAFQFIQVIKRHTDRLTKIVEDLLTLSRIESKGFQLKTQRVPISELITDALEFVKEGVEKKGISISGDDVSSSLSVQADRSYLEQVLINLLDNAIKYTPEGGRIEVSAEDRGDEEILFSVKDNGIGIPKEDLSRIFERFYRVDKGRSQEMGGTGLGLSIVKHIVQTHAGRVWAESQPGKGSTFYFTLPKSSP